MGTKYLLQLVLPTTEKQRKTPIFIWKYQKYFVPLHHNLKLCLKGMTDLSVTC